MHRKILKAVFLFGLVCEVFSAQAIAGPNALGIFFRILQQAGAGGGSAARDREAEASGIEMFRDWIRLSANTPEKLEELIQISFVDSGGRRLYQLSLGDTGARLYIRRERDGQYAGFHILETREEWILDYSDRTLRIKKVLLEPSRDWPYRDFVDTSIRKILKTIFLDWESGRFFDYRRPYRSPLLELSEWPLGNAVSANFDDVVIYSMSVHGFINSWIDPRFPNDIRAALMLSEIFPEQVLQERTKRQIDRVINEESCQGGVRGLLARMRLRR